jgi:hypothetical protein
MSEVQQENRHREGRGPRDARPPREGGREGGGRPDRGRPEGPPEIDLERLITDSLYLDNQAHSVVSRMRDMDSGTKRLRGSTTRCGAPAALNERQHQFVMLRAGSRTQSRAIRCSSLDTLENSCCKSPERTTRGYERFRDLFERCGIQQ